MSDLLGLMDYSPLTSSVEDSPVRTSPQPGRDRVWRVRSPDCFSRWPESLGKFDPGSCVLRTCQRSLVGGWMSYSGPWPLSGMMRAGEVCEHQRWVRPTVESGGSASAGWPTPAAQTFDQSPEVFDARRSRLKAKGINGNGAGRLLAVEVRRSWPTPSATDHKGSSKPGQRRGQLTEPLEPGSGGRLSPSWVEALQGFPLDWTSLTDGPPLQDHSTPGSLPGPDHDSPTTESD
jgi:hypothetical protein